MASSVRTVFGRPAVIYTVIALAVMLPLLAPGHVLTLDIALTPELPFPDTNSSSFLFRFILYLLNVILPTHVIEKLIFIAILLLSGLGMHRLVERHAARRSSDAAELGVYIAGAFYMINPFTYSRFMAGQYSVLLGYALLPFFAYALLKFLRQPSWRQLVPLTIYALMISIVSIHSVGMAAILVFAGLIGSAWRYRNTPNHMHEVLKYGGIAVLIMAVVSSYWLVPFLTGDSPAGQAAQGYGLGDRQAYATVGDGTIGKFANIIRLQGFWAEARNLYLLPQDHIPAWGVITIAVWVLVWKGARRLVSRGHRFDAFVVGSSGAMAAVLAASGIDGWALNILPELGGFREPHKLVGLLALSFAYFAAMGVPAVFDWLKQRGQAVATAGLSLALILPVLWTPTMFWGFAGQLSPREYPADWFALNERLNQDNENFKVLFLPWHMYMHFKFAGRIIVNPAADFFDKPTIVSNDPEYSGSSLADQDPLKHKLSSQILPSASKDANLAGKLAREGIKYLLLAQETDAGAYSYLNNDPDWKLVYQGDTLELYRNMAWEATHHE